MTDEKNKTRKYIMKIVETDDSVILSYQELDTEDNLLSEKPTTGYGERLYNQNANIAKDMAEEYGKVLRLEGREVNVPSHNLERTMSNRSILQLGELPDYL